MRPTSRRLGLLVIVAGALAGGGWAWAQQATARLGQPVTCQIIVKSLSANRLHQVVLRARVPAEVAVKATEPRAAAEGDLLTWDLGTLEPRHERRLDLLLVPSAKVNLALN